MTPALLRRNADATLPPHPWTGGMDHWQDFDRAARAGTGAWHGAFDAPMPDGSRLRLPLRDLGDHAVAGLIANQASFRVLDTLAEWLAERVGRYAADIVVGLPTLGHVVAAGVARTLGHANWVPAGFSRKIWYEEALSVPVASITSPQHGRLMWLDPRLLPRLRGRRVLLVDDVVSTGTSMRAGLALLRAAGIVPIAAAVAMIQGDRWRERWDNAIPLHGAFATPLFQRGADGWLARPETAPHGLCEAP
jgi:adenine/guanine phosphoribosyltransferase-like PRPP-binding protein